MTITDRDRKALQLLAGALVLLGVAYFWPDGSAAESGPLAADSPALVEQRLERVRRLMLQVPDKEAAQKAAQGDLAAREKGLLQADTAPQAQAQLFQILRRVGRSLPQPVEIRANEIGQAKSFGDDYGEVSVSVSFECGIEQLVNFLAELGAQPELLATSDLRLGAAREKDKILPVRLTVAGLVPRKLIPEKKGLQF
ncbi:MAG: type II secretion system protein GspM [Acidobacteria bacterium]|nr:type II secretion system protein GspM [Acidobacteriota bacterium]